MTIENNYERIGKFIYTAHRHGGDVSDVHHWMADELRVARPNSGAETVPTDLYSAFFAKYASGEDFQAVYERFVKTIKARNC